MSHQIRLEDDVYERIKANKRDDESFSDAVERLVGGRSLGDLRDVFDEEQVTEMRDAIDQADQQDRDEVRDVAERFELTMVVMARVLATVQCMRRQLAATVVELADTRTVPAMLRG